MGAVLEVGMIVSAIASTAATVASAQSANNTNRAIANSTNKSNLQLAREQNAFNERMWNQTNAYNDPAAQADRLMNAGLSQSAAAQAVSGVPAQPIQSANLSNQQLSAPMQPVDFSGLNMIGLARQMEALRKEGAEATSAEGEAKMKIPLLTSEKAKLDWANRIASQTLAFESEKHPYHMSALRYEKDMQKYREQALDLANQISSWQVKQMDEDFNFTVKLHSQELDKVVQEIKNLKKEGSNLDKSGKLIEAQTHQSNEMTANIQQSTQNLETQNEGIKFENRLKQLDVILKEAGMPETVIQRVSALVASGEVDFDTVAESLPVMRNYIESGYKEFKGDILMDAFLERIYDEGLSHELNTSFTQFGILKRALDSPSRMFDAFSKKFSGYTPAYKSRSHTVYR